MYPPWLISVTRLASEPQYLANVARVDNDRRYKSAICAASTGMVNATEMQKVFYRKCGGSHAKSTLITSLHVKKKKS